MAEITALKVELRDRVGTGGARATRRAGQIPGIVYGNNEDPVAIAIELRDANKELNRPGFMSHLYELQLDGKKVRALPRDVQYDVVKGQPLHIDFLRVSRKSQIVVGVPVTFINEDASPGLKRGGVLNVLIHELELKCPADSIPEVLEIDVTGLEIGDTIHLVDVTLAKGIEAAHPDRDNTIATMVAPSSVKSEATAEGEAGEAEEAESETEGGGESSS
ncbi:MAG: 50S ribosomal protein L25/general stress protein Ctc [Pseudomonadota bacterium]